MLIEIDKAIESRLSKEAKNKRVDIETLTLRIIETHLYGGTDHAKEKPINTRDGAVSSTRTEN